jgi:hypothetical protein
MVAHNLCYVGVGLTWLSLAEDGEARVRQGGWVEAHPGLAPLCFLVFADNVVSRIEGRSHQERGRAREGGR